MALRHRRAAPPIIYIYIYIYINLRPRHRRRDAAHGPDHEHLKLYCFFSSPPSHISKIEGQGGQDRDGDDHKGEDR